jgi:hypothetical protein
MVAVFVVYPPNSLAENRVQASQTPVRIQLHRHALLRYRGYMSKVDLDFNEPVPLTAEEDEETLAAIDRGIQAADEGRTVSVEEAREMISQWIVKSASLKTR